MADHQPGAIDAEHRRIIAVIEPVLRKYGFGLAGGNALRVLGLSTRPTRDVNYFTARLGILEQAVPEVEAALSDAGFKAEFDNRGGVTRDHADWDAQWVVIVSQRRIVLHLHVDETFPQPTIVSGIGPVYGAEAVLGAKVIAMVVRADARDFYDVYQALQLGWTPERLIALAWGLNPDDYDAGDFTGVVPNLRLLGDADFTPYGLNDQQVRELRLAFEERWPARE